MSAPKALVLHADGTNRDHEAAQALEMAGANPEIVHVNQLRSHERRWGEYQLLVLPGGFAYADALGAGKVLALELNTFFADEVQAFVESGKPVVGICNGFQALVKAGILGSSAEGKGVTLTFNADGRFECRWVTLAARSETCIWTRGLRELIYCPVAHGEGQFLPRDAATFSREQVALCYTRADGTQAGGYPDNPNGSFADVAGICNPLGNVLGFMPHPEDHLFAYQHPRRARGGHGRMGLPLFENGVRYAAGL